MFQGKTFFVIRFGGLHAEGVLTLTVPGLVGVPGLVLLRVGGVLGPLRCCVCDRQRYLPIPIGPIHFLRFGHLFRNQQGRAVYLETEFSAQF